MERFAWLRDVLILALLLAAAVVCAQQGKDHLADTLGGGAIGFLLQSVTRSRAAGAAGALLGLSLAAAAGCATIDVERLARQCAPEVAEATADAIGNEVIDGIERSRPPEEIAAAAAARVGWRALFCAVDHLLRDPAPDVAGPALPSRHSHRGVRLRRAHRTALLAVRAIAGDHLRWGSP